MKISHYLLCLLFVMEITSCDSINNSRFNVIINVPYTPPKNQTTSISCWAFATLSFLESEFIRKHGDTLDLSELFVISHANLVKAKTYMAKKGQMHFAPSGLCHDVLYVIGQFGIAPELPAFQTAENINYVYMNFQNLKDYLSGKKEVGLGNCANLQRSFLDTCPAVFDYKSKHYSPMQFRDSILRFNRSDYVELSSFLDYAFYGYFNLNVPDNWMQVKYYNLPMDTLTSLCISSLKKGYTFVWDGDVSEPGYGHVSILQKQDKKLIKKLGLDNARMEQFNKHQTTDDHLMHVVGLAKGKKDKLFFIMKNSYGYDDKAKGLLYMSEEYFRLKTVSAMLHKDVVPNNLVSDLRQLPSGK